MPVSICPTKSQCLFHAVTDKKKKKTKRLFPSHVCRKTSRETPKNKNLWARVTASQQKKKRRERTKKNEKLIDLVSHFEATTNRFYEVIENGWYSRQTCVFFNIKNIDKVLKHVGHWTRNVLDTLTINFIDETHFIKKEFSIFLAGNWNTVNSFQGSRLAK